MDFNIDLLLDWLISQPTFFSNIKKYCTCINLSSLEKVSISMKHQYKYQRGPFWFHACWYLTSNLKSFKTEPLFSMYCIQLNILQSEFALRFTFSIWIVYVFLLCGKYRYITIGDKVKRPVSIYSCFQVGHIL